MTPPQKQVPPTLGGRAAALELTAQNTEEEDQ